MIQSKRFRLAFLFAHLHKGGMQKAVSNISCALPEWMDQFIVFFGSEEPGFPYRAELVNLGVAPAPKGNYLGKAAIALNRIRRLQQFIDAEKLDAVVSFGEAANLINLLTRRKRTILSVRVSLPESLAQMGKYGGLYGGLVRRLYPKADVIVPVSEGIADQLSTDFGIPRRKMRTVYNGYPADRIRELASEPLPAEFSAWFNCPTVVNVASLVYQKGLEHLLRAFALAHRRSPELQLCLVGDGEKRAELESLARALGIHTSVLFTGFDPNPYRYLSRARVFVLPSRFEGFPNALVEAMICGLPVIATDCPTGPREILGDSEHGVLLPRISGANAAEVEEQMAEAIVLLSNDEARSLYSEKALYRSDAFHMETVVDAWLTVLGLRDSAE